TRPRPARRGGSAHRADRADAAPAGGGRHGSRAGAQDDREHSPGELHRHARAVAAGRPRRTGGAAAHGHVEQLGAGSRGGDRAGADMTRITTPFEWDSTAAEVIDGIDLSGKRAIVTGAASGIGVETARALAAAG